MGLMRIIAGEFRGRKLLPPEGMATRPITDRVKQSLFDILTPLLPGAVVYDCFAGTGSMGLECLSRQSHAVTFFESDRSALVRLRKNIEVLAVHDRSRVVRTDLFRYFADIREAPAARRPATLVFLDPPYRFVTDRSQALVELAHNLANHHLAPGAMVVFRHDSTMNLDLPPLLRHDSRGYGSMTLDFLKTPHQAPGSRH